MSPVQPGTGKAPVVAAPDGQPAGRETGRCCPPRRHRPRSAAARPTAPWRRRTRPRTGRGSGGRKASAVRSPSAEAGIGEPPARARPPASPPPPPQASWEDVGDDRPVPRPPDRDGHRLAEAHADRLLPRLERLRAVGREVSGRSLGSTRSITRSLNVAAGGGVRAPGDMAVVAQEGGSARRGPLPRPARKVRGLDPRQIPEDGRLQPQMGIVGQDRCAGIGPVAGQHPGNWRRTTVPAAAAGTPAAAPRRRDRACRRDGPAGRGRRCGTGGVGGRRERGRRAAHPVRPEIANGLPDPVRPGRRCAPVRRGSPRTAAAPSAAARSGHATAPTARNRAPAGRTPAGRAPRWSFGPPR